MRLRAFMKGPNGLQKCEVERCARNARQRFLSGATNVRAALENMVDELNGCIIYVGEEERRETLKGYPNGTFEIRLPVASSSARDNFTIAHELGHYYLHKPANQKDFRFTRRGSNRQEWEANWFAAEFLMPADDFIEQAEKCGYDIYELARYFQVSPSAANVRLSALNLI